MLLKLGIFFRDLTSSEEGVVQMRKKEKIM
jgi:hypothetical protein